MASPFDGLPPEPDVQELEQQIRAEIAASRRIVVALDDDPTGVQTVHDTPVLTVWDRESLAAELLPDPVTGPIRPLFFILTNSRSLPEADVVRLNESIAGELLAARDSVNAGIANPAARIDVVLVSRSDSTLRGHFPAEPDALARVLGGVDGIIVAPAFIEGGRFTIDDIHYVRDGETFTPAGETEFARDATFGFRSSNLREWVEEKSGGKVPASSVASLAVADIRRHGPDWVAEQLKQVSGGVPLIVNAAGYGDLGVVSLGILRAEAAGKRFVYRTAASIVRARAGISPRPLLTREELLGKNAPPYLPGLVVVGSHVRRSGEQLAALLELPQVTGIELNVPELLADASSRDAAVRQAGDAVDRALRSGQTAVLYTSRRVEHVHGGGEHQLSVSQTVSAALVAAVRRIEARPGFVVSKGGITSSDIGTRALEARRALVLGQVQPGVPVWRLGEESRYPGLPYVVFPGNVGEAGTLAEIVGDLRGA
jgi:uncharacterized protein YgbK (DUF1537 family)